MKSNKKKKEIKREWLYFIRLLTFLIFLFIWSDYMGTKKINSVIVYILTFVVIFLLIFIEVRTRSMTIKK